MSELAELLERFRRGAELLAVATTGAAGTELDFRPASDKWTVREITCHLADAEIAAATGLRQILAEENPTLVSWNEKAWTGKLGYEHRKISQALEMFRLLRVANYELLKDLPEDTFQRAGVHPQRGRLTLLQRLRDLAEHAEGHVKQIQGVRAQYKEQRAKQAGR